uniref:SCP domain-containing protein n=1 Tax=Caenorhabditis japonica TaxID=281687 RepID=A0A8R1HJ41_CAEJA
MRLFAFLILVLPYHSCDVTSEAYGDESTMMGLLNDYRLDVKIGGVPLNNKKLVVDETLTAEAKRLAASCEPPEHTDNYRASFQRIYPPNLVYDATQELVYEQKLEEAFEIVNSYSKPLPNFLEILVPTQEKIGCGRTNCSYEIAGVTIAPWLICLIGPKSNFSLADFGISETKTAGATLESTSSTSTESTDFEPTVIELTITENFSANFYVPFIFYSILIFFLLVIE